MLLKPLQGHLSPVPQAISLVGKMNMFHGMSSSEPTQWDKSSIHSSDAWASLQDNLEVSWLL